MEPTSHDAAYQLFIDALRPCRRVLITTHVKPDGDALGTTAALAMGLRQIKIDATVLLLSHLPRKYAFVYGDNGISHYDAEAGWPEGLKLDDYDAVLVADTGTWSQLPGLQARLENWPKPKLVLDHHLTQQNWADVKLVDTQAAAAGEIAAELLRRLDITLDRAIGQALYLALVSDTGWFQFSNTRPDTLRLAARLIEAGADTDWLYQRLFQSERVERIALQTRAQQSLRLFADGRLAVMQLGKDDFAQTGGKTLDTENAVNIPLQIGTVQVSILLTDPPEGGPIRASLRSKGQVDVARFAEPFGGGGHARAAGLKLESTLEQAQQRLVAAMTETFGGSSPASC